MKISENTFVAVSYKLSVGEGDDIELMEEAPAAHPLTFISGTGSMLPAFEDKLAGMGKGDKFAFTLSPEDAYGEYNDDYVVELPKAVFEVEGKFDTEQVYEGNTLPMMDSNGNRMNGSVLEIKEDIVVMNFNHPLAGEILHFEGEVLEVHEATAEEIAALSASCHCGSGCGCDDGNCGDNNCGDKHNEQGHDDCGGGCNCSGH